MKKFKAITLLTAATLALSALTACGINADNDKPTTTEPPQTSSSAPTSSSTPTETQKPTEADSKTESQPPKTDSAEELLAKIKNFPLGTAGSSAKGANIALAVINYAQFTDGAAQMRTACEKLKADMSDTQKQVFEDNLYEIDSFARDLIKGGNTKEYLESTENYRAGEYSLEKYEKLFNVLTEN